MPRKLTSKSSLENLKREAKRWLADLRSSEPDVRRAARERLERATPNAPADPGLRHVQHALARELELPGWSAIKAQLGHQAAPEPTGAERVAWFIDNACPDHHVRGGPSHVRAWHTARRLLVHYPEIANDSFYTAIACGDLERVRKELEARPQAANEKGGPKDWEPILYLCFSRAPLAAASDNALAIAQALLAAGAEPNVYFMAGGSRYTPLVGAVGEGEEDRPAHAHRDALVELLLDHGANPYDIQVIYNTGFHGTFLWFLEMTYAESVKRGRKVDWDDPEWRMLDMGGYGTGARWVLNNAVSNDNLALAEWALQHGANPNAGPPRARMLSHRSLHELAVRNGFAELADLLVWYGAVPSGAIPDPAEALGDACFRSKWDRARSLLAQHPDLLWSAQPMLTAATRDRVDVVECLLDAGVSPDVEDAEKQRPLHAAAFANSLRVAQLLIDRGAEIDPIMSSWSNTPIASANYAQHPAMIALLGRFSRDIWELTNAGNIDRLRELFVADPQLATTVSGGHTPLMWLPPEDESRALEIAKLFLSYGADPTVKNNDGQTAADRARRIGMFEVAALLENAVAD